MEKFRKLASFGYDLGDGETIVDAAGKITARVIDIRKYRHALYNGFHSDGA